MKFFIIGSLLALTSCGNYKAVNAPGASRLEPISMELRAASGNLINAVRNVCNALSQKEALLSTVVGSPLKFDISQTDCSGNSVSNGEVTVTVQRNGQDYIFKQTNGADFIFPEVETTSQGIFTEICQNSGNLQVPIVGANNGATFVSLSNDCDSASGEVCLEVKLAIIQGEQAIPHTSDVIRIRTNARQSKIGFFTYRNRVSKSFCGTNETINMIATLKN